MSTAAKPDVVNVHEAKTHLSKLLDRVHSGEEIIIAKAGKPYARLMPLATSRSEPRVLGRFAGVLPALDDAAFFDPLPEEELREWDDGSPE